ncbi:hypothetical protein [Planctobacterium marinum]|uniref:hypothetical protein n=1 Tax=Planctobacterium marinum TaxID=1631968 RepID=UPI0030C6BD01
MEQVENVDGRLTLQRTSKIQQLEKQYSRAYYVPGLAFLFVVTLFLVINFYNLPVSNVYLATLLAANILVSGNAAMRRMDYLRQIMALEKS